MGQDSNQFFFVSNEQLAMYRKIATAWFQGTFLGAFTQPSKQSVILVHAHVDHGTAKYFASIHERFRRIVNTKPCGGNQNNALIILSFKFGAAKHHRLGVWESNLLLRLRHSQNSLRENPQISEIHKFWHRQAPKATNKNKVFFTLRTIFETQPICSRGTTSGTSELVASSRGSKKQHLCTPSASRRLPGEK